MLAISQLTANQSAVIYFLAFVFAVVATIFALVTAPRAPWSWLVSGAFSLFFLVLFWNAAAAA